MERSLLLFLSLLFLPHSHCNPKNPITNHLGGTLTVGLNTASSSIYDTTTYTFLLTGTQRLTDSCSILFTFPVATGITYQSPLSCTVGFGFLKVPTCTVVSAVGSSDLVIQAQCTSTGTIDPAQTGASYTLMVRSLWRVIFA